MPANPRELFRLEGSWLKVLCQILLALIIVVSFESFNPILIGSLHSDNFQGGDFRQQAAAAVLWTLLMAVSFVPGVIREPLRTSGLQWPALFVAWAVTSAMWSVDPASALPKATVLFASTVATWRLASMITVREMFACLHYTLSALMVASLALVFLVPSIGVVQHEWLHVGNWSGVFASKQGLGMGSAVALGVALLRVTRKSWFDMAMCGVAFSCLYGSASRGGGIIAGVAVVCLVLERGYPRMLALLVSAILVLDLTVALGNIAYFTITGAPSYEFFGQTVDFTERTFIWQYALDLLSQRPLFGFGLNGFWTDMGTFYGYQKLHGWVLDNYHNGYIAVIVETGAVGLLLFLAASLKLIARLRWLIVNATDNRTSLEMSVAYVLMFFTLNLSEGLLLRSTNFLSVLFAFIVIKTVSVPSARPIGQLYQAHAWRMSRSPTRRVALSPARAGRDGGAEAAGAHLRAR